MCIFVQSVKLYSSRWSLKIQCGPWKVLKKWLQFFVWTLVFLNPFSRFSRGSTFRILHPSATRQLLAYAQTKVKLGGQGEAVTYSIQT